MADENKNGLDPQNSAQTNTEGQNQANNPTDGIKSDNKPDVLQFTQDALNAMMAKEKASGKRAVIKQFGLSDETDLPDTIAKFNAYLEAQKNQETDGDRLKNLSEKFDKLNNDHTAALAEVAALKQEKILKKYGVNDDEDIEIYGIRIKKLVTDEKDFSQAAAEYFTAHPIQTRPPEFHTGTGRTPIKESIIDSNTAAAARGAGIDPKKLKKGAN